MGSDELHFEERTAWRKWLEANFERASVLWLVFYKKHTGVATISYDAAVEEALCFGWIDSLIKRLDEDRFARKLTPRTNTSKWSELNLQRVEKLKAEGLMTSAGLAKIAPGVTPVVAPHKRPFEIPPYFREALAHNEPARLFFDELAPTYQRHFVLWVDSAKREETRRRRLAEAIARLESRQKLGMK